MSTTVLYRKSSGEVIKISPKGQRFPDRNQTYWGVLTDPPMPDGNICRDGLKNLRIPGFAKIVDGDTVRNATQDELVNFIECENEDEKQQDADGAAELLENHPRFRKLLVAFASILVDEINILRSEHNLPLRNIGQLRNAIRNRINKDD